MTQTDNIRRYGWNREAVAAALALCRLYHRDARFAGELAWLWDIWPKAASSTDVERPMAEDLFDFAGQDDRRLPGRGIQDYEQHYQQLWEGALKLLGPDDPWVRRVDNVAAEFGLSGATWGRGVIADMAQEYEFYFRRSQGETEVAEPWSAAYYWELYTEPQQKTDVPHPRGVRIQPGMTWPQVEALYKRELEEARTYFDAMNEALEADPRWSARSVELERDVRWLYERVTPPYRTPREIALRDNFGYRAVQVAIQRVSRLINLPLPKGRPRGRKQARRDG